MLLEAVIKRGLLLTEVLKTISPTNRDGVGLVFCGRTDQAVIAMGDSICLLPQRRQRQFGPCSDAGFRALEFGRTARGVELRRRRR